MHHPCGVLRGSTLSSFFSFNPRHRPWFGLSVHLGLKSLPLQRPSQVRVHVCSSFEEGWTPCMRMTAYDSWGERAALYMSVCVCRLGGELYAGTAVSTRHTAQHAWSGPAEPVSSLRALARSLLSFTRQQVRLCPTLLRWGLQSSVRQRFSRFFVFSHPPASVFSLGGEVSWCSCPVRGMDVLTGCCTCIAAS